MTSKDVKNSVKKISGKAKKRARKIKKKHGIKGVVFFYSVMVICITGCFLLFRWTLYKGVQIATDAFNAEKEKSREEMSAEYYEKTYESVEEKYHTSNQAIIQLGDLKDISRLEVLSIIQEGYVTETEDQKKNGIYTWTRFRGEGTYTVNLQVAEFIADSERKYVLVRIPKPEMTAFSLVPEETDILLYKDNSIDIPYTHITINDGSYKEGVALAVEQEQRAENSIKQAIVENQNNQKKAEDYAEEQVTVLLKAINAKNIPDLEVEVEFIE